MAVAPDGKTLAYLGATGRNDPLAQSLFVVPADGGEPRNLTPGLDASVADVTWIGRDEMLVLLVRRERHALVRVERTGARHELPWPRLVVTDLDCRAGRCAVAAESPSHPAEVYAFEATAPEPVRRTRHTAALDDLRLARQEVVEWRGEDALAMSGVLTYPTDYRVGSRYPLVLQIHGGPEGVSLDGWTTTAGSPVQLLAARGYVVLQPNYRGSQGRGVEFSKAVHRDLGGAEFRDVLAGVDALVESGLVDRDRVATGGWSYGGFLSAWAATRYGDRFRAAVVAAGLSNWVAFAGTTDIPHEMALVHWDSYWYDDPERHWSRSPLAHLATATTPTLIVHGSDDTRVHPEQGRELYSALRMKGVPTQLVLYPREGHGLRERAHRLDFIERTLGWFDRHLAPAPSDR
jgi:dipeptidyl aminopeptidase/acylaminoacyl peptidase